MAQTCDDVCRNRREHAAPPTCSSQEARSASGRPAQRQKGTLMSAHPRARSSLARAFASPRTARMLAVKWWGPSTSIATRSPVSCRGMQGWVRLAL